MTDKCDAYDFSRSPRVSPPSADAEREALAWLDELADPQNRWSDGVQTNARILKAMLAVPRLPEEPSEEIVWRMRHAVQSCVGWDDGIRRTYRALYTHLTRPKKKWGVCAGCGWVHFDEFSEAMKAVEAEAKSGNHAVTIERREMPR